MGKRIQQIQSPNPTNHYVQTGAQHEHEDHHDGVLITPHESRTTSLYEHETRYDDEDEDPIRN